MAIPIDDDPTSDSIKKAIAALLTGLLAWGGSVVVSNPTQITAGEWVQAGGVAVGAFLVWLVPNQR